MKKSDAECIVVGGGLAGLTAALLLQQMGREVLVLEARGYPRHKVCGEFISREVLPLFESLDLWPTAYELPQITKLRLSVSSGRQLELPLSHGALGWSRYHLDAHLAHLFEARGGQLLRKHLVRSIRREGEYFRLQLADGSTYRSKVVLAALGKRSSLDRDLQIEPLQRSPWTAWKMHFHQADFPAHEVHLHNFPGGYAGLSRVEEGRINLASLLHQSHIRPGRPAWPQVKRALAQNPHLRAFFASAEALFSQPVAISQLDYGTRPQVARGVLLLGDTAGMIHPLSGNGMAMAMGSAQLAAAAVQPFLNGRGSRHQMEAHYRHSWQAQYRRRLQVSRLLRRFFAASQRSEWALQLAIGLPPLTRWLERQTHGKAPAL